MQYIGCRMLDVEKVSVQGVHHNKDIHKHVVIKFCYIFHFVSCFPQSSAEPMQMKSRMTIHLLCMVFFYPRLIIQDLCIYYLVLTIRSLS